MPEEVLICDDGSGLQTGIVIRKWQPRFPVPLRHCWQEDDGWRVARVRNLGIRESSSDYIVFLDGDCVPERHFMEDHRKLAEAGYVMMGDRSHVREAWVSHFHPRFPTVLWFVFRNRLRKRSHAFRNPLERPEEHSFETLTAEDLGHLAVGCNLGVWKKNLEEVNGFNMTFSGWGLEDVELVARLLAKGIKGRKVRRRSIVFHLDHFMKPYDEDDVLEPVRAVFRTKTYRTGVGLEEERG